MLEVMMPLPLKACVQNGRLVLDEPTDLPEGEVVYLVPVGEADQEDDLDDEERAALHRSLERGLADSRAGRVIDAEVVMAKLRSRRTDS